jgi:protocatechuate 3,4-dioxygenase beta subunit
MLARPVAELALSALLLALSGILPAREISPRAEPRVSSQADEWFGRVVSQFDLSPVVGARIIVEPVPEGGLMADVAPLAALPADAVTTTSGADGGFAINAAVGRRLRVSAEGFLDGFVLLHENRDRDLGRLVLRHAMSFSGRVLVGGRPVAGVEVMVPADHDFGVGSTWSVRTTTGDSGTFRLDGLRPEQTHEIIFIRDGLAHAADLGHPLYPFDARHYEVGDIEIPTSASLAGVVTAPDGSPVRDALVWVTWSTGAMRLPRSGEDTDRHLGIRLPQGLVAADGRFELSVLSGSYRVAAFSPRFGSGLSEADSSTQGQGATLEINLPGALSHRGRVVDPAGAPIPDAAVLVRTNRPETDTTPYGEPLRFEADAAGCFVAGGLPLDETSWVTIEAPGYVPSNVEVGNDAPLPDASCADVPSYPLQPSGSITGVVLDEQGTPVVGALVSADRAQHVGGYLAFGRQPATTDEQGRFRFDDLPFGDYTLYVRDMGHLTTTAENIALGALDEGAPAPRDRDVRVVVAPIPSPIPLETLVLDARGAPVPEADVNADYNSGGMAAQFPSPEKGFTGADGRVVFDGAGAGLYSISASADGLRDSSGWQGPFRMEQPGALAIVEMRERPPSTSLSGRLVDAQGNGVARAIIHADGSMRRHDTARTLSEADGSFRFDSLALGQWVLKAELAGGLEVLHRGLLEVGSVELSPEVVGVAPSPEVVGAEPLPQVVIRVPQLGRITGRVDNTRPEELDELWVSAGTSEHHEGIAGQSTSVRVKAAPDGTFELLDLIPGEWRVSARVSDGRDGATTVQVAEGETVSDVGVPLASGLTLSGRLVWRDGTDPDELAAWVRLAGSTTGQDRDLRVGADGVFQVRDLPPDLYDVMVSGGGLRAPFFLPVEVRGDTQVEIPMRGASVSGTVVDAETGDPIPGVGIRTDPIPQRTSDMHDQFRDTDRNGGFEAGPFPAGLWRFAFSALGYGTRAPVIEIGDEDMDEYVVALDPTPGLRLVFTTPDGSKPPIISLAWRDLEIGEGLQWSVFPESTDTMEFVLPSIRLTRGLLQASNNSEWLAARAVIANTGAPVTVALELAGRLRVTLEPPSEPTLNRPVARILDAEGLPVTNLNGEPERRFLRRREGEFYLSVLLPPGIYRMELQTHDGRQLNETFEIFAREQTELNLR